jgi:hypothetical protein
MKIVSILTYLGVIIMMIKQKKHLAIAVSLAATIGLGAATNAQAVDFTATATVENTLAVTNLADFAVGTVFATVTGAALTNGVGALVISPTGAVTDPADSASVQLINLGTPVPAQGSVDMTSSFSLTLPDTSTVDAADFVANAGGGADTEITAGATVTELVHSSGDPAVPSLFMMHFTVGDVSGGTATEGTSHVGDFTVAPDFGATTYVFNIGATVTTEPTSAAASYQAGVYTGTFAVTATY